MIYDCILDIAHKKLSVHMIISLEDYKLTDMHMDEYIDVEQKHAVPETTITICKDKYMITVLSDSWLI